MLKKPRKCPVCGSTKLVGNELKKEIACNNCSYIHKDEISMENNLQ